MDDFIDPFLDSSSWSDLSPSVRSYKGDENLTAEDVGLYGHDGSSSAFTVQDFKFGIRNGLFSGDHHLQNLSQQDNNTHDGGFSLPAGFFGSELNTPCSVTLAHNSLSVSSSIESSGSEPCAFPSSLGDAHSINCLSIPPMDAATALRSPSSTPNLTPRRLSARRTGPVSFNLPPRPRIDRSISLSPWRPASAAPRRSRPVRASASPSPQPPPSPIAPLKMESPIGEFLSQILTSHPHLLPAAVDQQLHQLKTARDADSSKATGEPLPPPSTDIVLYRRINELKASERRKSLEEILYALVVQKFVEADVSLVPALSQPADSDQRVDGHPSEEEKLEALHSAEAYEMIKNHLSLILGHRLGDTTLVAPISKLRIGQVYAASVMYGYFLKRVDQRFQLEKSMKSLPWGSDEEESAIKQAVADEPQSAQALRTHPEVSNWTSPTEGVGQGAKQSRLRSYVMSFDSDTLQRYATIRSKEAFTIIEKHTEALFGRPEIVIGPGGAIDSSKDETLKISFAGLRRLILEAVTFGSFLWDVESYVDSRYHFVTN